MHTHRTIVRWAALAGALCLLAAGCAVVPRPTRSPHAGGTDPLGRCAELFAALDERAVRADALDGGAFRVEGHPYLRVDRFLASFRDEALDDRAFGAWIDRMQALDLEARRHELANSSAGARSADEDAALLREAAACGDRMKAVDFATAERRAAFRGRLTVPDEYIRLRRVLGIYPVVSFFVSAGVSNWHDEARQTFANDPPPHDPRMMHYASAGGADAPTAARVVSTAPRDGLGVPVYDEVALELLFRRHAPAWRVQTATDDDRIGSPRWDRDGEIGVDTASPTVFTLLSFTRFGTDVLTQLNFVVWFPARPKESAVDIYGGRLDGVNFRVTLDADGTPLLYEKIHNCGCYYTAYPTTRLQVRADVDYAEHPLILPAPAANERRPALALESGTHYVHRFFLDESGPAPAVALPLTPYDRLRSLPTPEGGRRSMFAPDGLVPGSERLERFILWPTGVDSPGGMRQWGRHAVAFVGERHFDDPFALDRMFVRAGAPCGRRDLRFRPGFLEQRVKIERPREHGDAALGIARPFGLGAVPVELDPVAVGIGQVERLADPVVARPVERHLCGDQPPQRLGQRGTRVG